MPTTSNRAMPRSLWLQIPSESQSDYRQDIRACAPECPAQKTAANFRRSVARNYESFSGHCVLPQIWSNLAVKSRILSIFWLSQTSTWRTLNAFFTHTTPNLTVPRFGLVPGAPTTTGAQLEPLRYAPVSTSQSEVVGNLQTQAYYD